MALVRCAECKREISDKATACPGCGAPVLVLGTRQSQAPTRVQYNRAKDTFTGTMLLVVKLAMRAVQDLGWETRSGQREPRHGHVSDRSELGVLEWGLLLAEH